MNTLFEIEEVPAYARLPLFTGEAETTTAPPAPPTARQAQLTAACQVCLDTGRLADGHFCTCPTGVKVRERAS